MVTENPCLNKEELETTWSFLDLEFLQTPITFPPFCLHSQQSPRRNRAECRSHPSGPRPQRWPECRKPAQLLWLQSPGLFWGPALSPGTSFPVSWENPGEHTPIPPSLLVEYDRRALSSGRTESSGMFQITMQVSLGTSTVGPSAFLKW